LTDKSEVLSNATSESNSASKSRSIGWTSAGTGTVLASLVNLVPEGHWGKPTLIVMIPAVSVLFGFIFVSLYVNGKNYLTEFRTGKNLEALEVMLGKEMADCRNSEERQRNLRLKWESLQDQKFDIIIQKVQASKLLKVEDIMTSYNSGEK
jgi:hypothetical protein